MCICIIYTLTHMFVVSSQRLSYVFGPETIWGMRFLPWGVRNKANLKRFALQFYVEPRSQSPNISHMSQNPI